MTYHGDKLGYAHLSGLVIGIVIAHTLDDSASQTYDIVHHGFHQFAKVLANIFAFEITTQCLAKQN